MNTHIPASFDRHRMLDARQVAEILNYSVAHVRRMYRTGKIPKPIVIGGRKKAWPAGVILDMTNPNGGAQ